MGTTLPGGEIPGGTTLAEDKPPPKPRRIPYAAPPSRSVPAFDDSVWGGSTPFQRDVHRYIESELGNRAAEQLADKADLRGKIASAIESERPAERGMPEVAKSDLWNSTDKAVVAICELLGLLFGLPFGDDLYHNEPVTGWHLFYLAIGIVFAGGGPMWPWMRTQPWFSEKIAARVSRAATDPLTWVGLLVLLFLYKTGPESYQRATTPNPVSSPVVIGFTQKQVDEKIAGAIETYKTNHPTTSETANPKSGPPPGREIGYLTIDYDVSSAVISGTSASIKEAIVQSTRRGDTTTGLNSVMPPVYSIPIRITFDKDYGPFDVFMADANLYGLHMGGMPYIAVTGNESSRLEILLTSSSSSGMLVSGLGTNRLLLSIRKQQ
jgi:hypothetical protein